MTRLKYLDPTDGQYKLLPVGGGSGGAGEDEVFVGPTDPGVGAGYELWYDTDAVDPYYGQGVMRFANDAARNAAIPSPTEGMTVWMLDSHQQRTYYNSMWVVTGGVQPWGIARWGNSNMPAGWARVTHSPHASQLQGGITLTSEGVFILPLPGLYAVNVRAYLSASSAARSIAASYSADGGTNWAQLEQGDFTAVVGGQVGISVAATAVLPVNSRLAPTCYASTGYNYDGGAMDVTYISAG